MNKQQMKKWITELRSGKYKQGTRKLYRGSFHEYCCLGIACKTLGVDESKMDNMPLPMSVECDLGLGKIRRKVAEKALGRRVNNWVGNLLRVEDVLAHMNDEHFTFDEIADFLEQVVLPALEGSDEAGPVL